MLKEDGREVVDVLKDNDLEGANIQAMSSNLRLFRPDRATWDADGMLNKDKSEILLEHIQVGTFLEKSSSS